MTRHPLAKARDEFLESEAGRKACDLPSLHCGAVDNTRAIYLRNRIEAAFIAGWNARAYYELTEPIEP
jgi:hypothetical protein